MARWSRYLWACSVWLLLGAADHDFGGMEARGPSTDYDVTALVHGVPMDGMLRVYLEDRRMPDLPCDDTRVARRAMVRIGVAGRRQGISYRLPVWVYVSDQRDGTELYELCIPYTNQRLEFLRTKATGVMVGRREGDAVKGITARRRVRDGAVRSMR